MKYEDAGVSIDAGNELIRRIIPLAERTRREGVLGGIGSFAGAFRLPSGYKRPVLLAATDGVGTKLRLAIDSGRLDTIGIDLVAMCVNDLLCSFAAPLFFLDYFATGRLDVGAAQRIIAGVAEGCVEAGCALLGGESAELPGLYSGLDFDLAGFAVGVAEEDEIERKGLVKNGDLILALPSTGLHSNGYSLARKVFFEELKMSFEDELAGQPLIDLLLAPTRIYVRDFLKLKPHINALAHITGGGVVENIPRVLPRGLGAALRTHHFRIPPLFAPLAEVVGEEELFRVFNMGVGMALIVSSDKVGAVLEASDAYPIGEVILGEGVSLD